MFVRAFRLYTAFPGAGVRCDCVCLGSGFGCAPPFLGCGVRVCVFVCALRLYPANPGWGFWCMCLGSGFRFHPAIPGLVAGVLCLVLDLALAACWGAGLVCLCLDFAFSHPILPGLLSCVCSCACSASTPPFLAGVCGACVRARVLALPRHLWLGCVV